jgi:hypothetical protein
MGYACISVRMHSFIQRARQSADCRNSGDIAANKAHSGINAIDQRLLSLTETGHLPATSQLAEASMA